MFTEMDEGEDEDEATDVSELLEHLHDDMIDAIDRPFIDDTINLVEKYKVAYLSGYVARRLGAHLKCECCARRQTTTNPLPNHLYIQLREWDSSNRCLTYPTVALSNTVEEACNFFFRAVTPQLHRKALGKFAVDIMSLELSMSAAGVFCDNHVRDGMNFLAKGISRILIHR